MRNPVNGKKALQTINDSGGTAVTGQDSEIFVAEQEIARLEGLFAEPSSSATIAALKKLLDQGVVDGGRICCVSYNLEWIEGDVCASGFGEEAEDRWGWFGVEY